MWLHDKFPSTDKEEGRVRKMWLHDKCPSTDKEEGRVRKMWLHDKCPSTDKEEGRVRKMWFYLSCPWWALCQGCTSWRRWTWPSGRAVAAVTLWSASEVGCTQTGAWHLHYSQTHRTPVCKQKNTIHVTMSISVLLKQKHHSTQILCYLHKAPFNQRI